MNRLIVLLAALTFLTACQSGMGSQTRNTKELRGLMEGSFRSLEQSEKDSSYFDISLHMYPVWESQDGFWFYVEQALATMQDKPYRQRMYKVEYLGDDRYSSAVYAFKEPKQFIGKWISPEFFDAYDTSCLSERMGCAVILKRRGNNWYEGSTVEKECGSTMRGASYATSVVSIKQGVISSWDQGFDKEDQQVWGAEKGPYIFTQIN